MINIIYYFQSRIGYAYKENEEIFEKTLITNFLAENYELAIKMAVRHANERYKNYLKDAYISCFLANIKINLMCMQPIQSDGSILPSFVYNFFEWKCDFPGSLDDYIKTTIRKLGKEVVNDHLQLRSSETD